MTRRTKIVLWLGLVLSVPAMGYGAISFVFYAWLSAAEPERWPPDRAGLWAGGAVVLTVLFSGVFIYCLVSLIKEANRRYRNERIAALQ